jgi:hypothetical protein
MDSLFWALTNFQGGPTPPLFRALVPKQLFPIHAPFLRLSTTPSMPSSGVNTKGAYCSNCITNKYLHATICRMGPSSPYTTHFDGRFPPQFERVKIQCPSVTLLSRILDKSLVGPLATKPLSYGTRSSVTMLTTALFETHKSEMNPHLHTTSLSFIYVQFNETYADWVKHRMVIN